jgi:signal transduction histidine kinase
MNISQESILKLFNHSKYPIYIIDDAYHILYNNLFIEKKYPNIIGDKCFYALFGRSKPCEKCIYFEAIKNNDITVNSLNRKNNILEIDGSCIKNIGLPIIEDDMTKCVIIEFDDTQETLKYEEKLNELEALSNMLEQNQQVQNEKDIYYTNQAHEISRFIQNIHFRLDLLEKEYPKIMKNENCEGIRNLIESSENALNRLFQFNDVNSIKEINEDVFNFSNLIQRIKKRYYIVSKNRKINFKINISKDLNNTYIGSSQSIRQIIENILDNAFDFTTNGDIKLHIYPIETTKNESKIKINITDTGIGIPKEHIDLIYRRYYKKGSKFVNGFTRAGLGLSISKALAEALKGEINVESKLGEGTSVSVILPLKNISEEKNKKNDLQNVKKNLLIIGLPELSKFVLKMKLNISNRVKMVDRGDDGLIAYYQFKPDLVLMDVMAPGLNAFDFLDEVTANDTHKAKIIVASTKVLDEESDYLKSYGFHGYIPKPIKYNELINLLENIEMK